MWGRLCEKIWLLTENVVEFHGTLDSRVRSVKYMKMTHTQLEISKLEHALRCAEAFRTKSLSMKC